MLLNVEENEDVNLIINSFKELLDREWNILGNKKHEATKEKVQDLFYKIKDLGIFQFLKENSNIYSFLINEVIGQNLLPGIIATTAISRRDSPTTIGVKYVPEIDKAEFVITPYGIAKVSDVEYIEVKSPDPSVKMYKIISGKWEKKEDFNLILLNASSQVIGHGIYCLTKAIEYAKNRVAFGKPIGSYEAIKHKIVDDAIGLELARSRYLANVGEPESVFEYSFKKSFKAILDSIQVHGGIGFTTDLDLHLHLKRIIMIQKILSPLIT
ncbi:acyl-CoA dehydrogenase family protein [Sulfurisphaera javensis]|uniref:Acyl-CoA dehydrogenase family protein n=1 Tax=Sulfurisphaera javensis TaxID=2049879 RepID=A0AAT9GQI9_9CREN